MLAAPREEGVPVLAHHQSALGGSTMRTSTESGQRYVLLLAGAVACGERKKGGEKAELDGVMGGSGLGGRRRQWQCLLAYPALPPRQ